MVTIQVGKLQALVQSRKFWALITSLVSLACAAEFHGMPVDQAIQLGVAALAAYSLGTAIEDINPTPPVPTPVYTISTGSSSAPMISSINAVPPQSVRPPPQG